MRKARPYIYFTDPGHGWLRVKRAELEDLGIAGDITPYSYTKGQWVYLEEDLDMATFMKAKGWLVEVEGQWRVIKGFWDSGLIVGKNCRRRYSAIRSYDRYYNR